jgi:HlyD family secretion protein
VRMSVSQAEIDRLGGLKLLPGMPVESFIQTSPRTVMSYLTKPLQDQVSRAFRER